MPWTEESGGWQSITSYRVRHNWSDLACIRHWWKKSKMTHTGGEIYHVLGSEESILWKWPYYTSNLQSQSNPFQTTSGIFHITRTNNCTICMEKQRTLNSQSNLEKEKWSWRNQPSSIQITLQGYSHQDTMVLAQNQKNRQMEQDRKPRDKPMHIWVPYFWQRRWEYTMGQR